MDALTEAAEEAVVAAIEVAAAALDMFQTDKPNVPGYIVSEGSGVFSQVEYKDMCLPNPSGTNWTPKLLDKVYDKKQEIKSKVTDSKCIEKDNQDLDEMVLSSKNGKWGKVFRILDKKPHLINAIPKERAWSVLHQAVYLNNIQSVQKLLSYKTCDVTIKAKRDREECGKPGDTPLELGEKHNRQQIVSIFKKHATSIPEQAVPTFVPADIGEGYIQHGVPYFLLSLAFLEKSVVHKIGIQESSSFISLTEKTYQHIQSNWEYARDAVAECLYPFNKRLHDDLKATKSYKELFKEIVAIYTGDDVYRQVNEALRRASVKLEPTGDDMLLCLYSLFLEAILLHFDEIDCFEGTSYRGITSMGPGQVQEYKKGEKFVWLQFVSSSTDKSVAKKFGAIVEEKSAKAILKKKKMIAERDGSKVLFIINNQGVTKASPRKINLCSRFGHENEVLYPAGSEFEVSKIENQNGTRNIYLDLIHVHN